MFCVGGRRDDPLDLIGAGATRVRVRLRIEPAVLSSALEQFLAGNPGLEIEVCRRDDDTGQDTGQDTGHQAGHHTGHHTGPGAEVAGCQATRPVVEIRLLEDPFRFQLEIDGHAWIVNYQGLDDLAQRLTDLEHWRVVFG